MFRCDQISPVLCRLNERPHLDHRFLRSVRLHGVVQPPLVVAVGKSSYRIAHGRKRIAAAVQLGLPSIWARILPADTDELEVVRLVVAEHLQDDAVLGAAFDAAEYLAQVDNAAASSRATPLKPSVLRRLSCAKALCQEARLAVRGRRVSSSAVPLLASLPQDKQRELVLSAQSCGRRVTRGRIEQELKTQLAAQVELCLR